MGGRVGGWGPVGLVAHQTLNRQLSEYTRCASAPMLPQLSLQNAFQPESSPLLPAQGSTCTAIGYVIWAPTWRARQRRRRQ